MKNNMINSRSAKIAVAILLLAYIVSPIDLVSDVIPLAGWLDDLMAAAVLARNIYSMFEEKPNREEELPEAEVIDE